MTTFKNFIMTRKAEKMLEKAIKKDLGADVNLFINDLQINNRSNGKTRLTVSVSVDASQEDIEKIKTFYK